MKDPFVLLVDDFKLARFSLKTMLIRFGVKNIVEAQNGREALKIINESHHVGTPVHLVLCDLNMPEMSGLELLTALRATQEFKSLPVVIITVESDPKIVQKIMDAGATECLSKPLFTRAIENRIQDLINNL